MRFTSALLLLLPLLVGASLASPDAVKDAKSKDPLERLAAAGELATSEHKDAEKTLRRLLGDKDWEVAQVAALSLAQAGTEKSVDELVKTACGGPVRPVRLAAAAALAAIDPATGFEGIEKQMKGDSALLACEALAIVAPALESPPTSKKLERLLESDEMHVRMAAARASVALARTDREEVLRSLLESPFLALRGAALEAAKADPLVAQVEALIPYAEQIDLPDVLSRRSVDALASGLAAGGDEGSERAAALVTQLCGNAAAPVAQRGVQLARRLHAIGFSKAADLVVATGPAREHGEGGVRALSARLLALLDAEEAQKAALELYGDRSTRVRVAAARAVLTRRPVTTDEGRDWALAELSSASDRELRETLVVALGHPDLGEHGGTVSALANCLADSDWGVACCAAVSLGMTRAEDGVGPLVRLASESEDWRLRGAAVVGLSESLHKEGVPAVIERLGDEEPSVARTAYAFLLSIALGDRPEATVDAWTEWWAANGDKVRLFDPKERRERREKYGYSTPPAEIYKGLDVAVLESRGDQMQVVLDRLEIEHRLTSSNRVAADGLDASGVFVANCTGEIEGGDVERLAWFVKVGGYLCGSCWALTETIGRVAPGYVSKFQTRDEVLDKVEASLCDADSPYLVGVFGDGVRPIYNLEGSHLLQVDRPEAVEMLVDSLACAERWGGGNLACWFRWGHGTILDSANHFRNQGFENVLGLKKDEERKAYAVEHMGASYEFLRETAKAKFWGSTTKAAGEVFDLSVFRLVTNFVRQRRIEGR